MFFRKNNGTEKRDLGTWRYDTDGFFDENDAFDGRKCDGEKCSRSVVDVRKSFAEMTARKNVTWGPERMEQMVFFYENGTFYFELKKKKKCSEMSG